MRLPGELRNHIYAYALHDTSGIYLGKDEHRGWHFFNGPPSRCPAQTGFRKSAVPFEHLVWYIADMANQLQFVDRQLHKETRWLSSHCSDVIFVRVFDLQAFQRVFRGQVSTSALYPHQRAFKFHLWETIVVRDSIRLDPFQAQSCHPVLHCKPADRCPSPRIWLATEQY